MTSSEGKREEAGTEGRDLYGALPDVEFREQIGSLVLAILVYWPTRVESKSAQCATHSTVKRTVGAGEAEAKSRSELGWFCTATTVPIQSPLSRSSSAHHSLFRSYLYSLFRSHLSISIHKPLFLFVSVSRTNSCSANFTRPASRDARHAPETLMHPSVPLRDDRAPQYPCRHYISLSVTLITEPLTLLPTDSPAWVKIPSVHVHSQADWCVTHHRSPVSPPTK